MDANKYKGDCVSFLKRLVQTRSVNGIDNESAIAKAIADEAEKLKLPYRLIPKDKRRPNVFVGERLDDKDSLLMVAHLDTVSEGTIQPWEHEPFAAIVSGSRIYGRGAIDCKGGIAIAMYTLKLLADAGKLDRAKFVGVVDEESGADSQLGLEFLLNQGLQAKEAVYTYGGGSGQTDLTIGHRGLLRLWVTCHGESVHSGFKDWQDRKLGENAIEGIVELLNELKTFTMAGENKYFPGYKFVLTPTIIQGGVGESIVPDSAKVLLDMRLLPEHDGREIVKRITAITDKLSSAKRTYSLEIKNSIPGALTDPNSDIVKRALTLNQKVFGVESRLKGSGPANEGYMLITRGIPTITGYGPDGANAHGPNEYADLSSIVSIIGLLAELAG